MDKLRQKQEITAYRIIKRNILKIVNGIPFNNMSKLQYFCCLSKTDYYFTVNHLHPVLVPC